MTNVSREAELIQEELTDLHRVMETTQAALARYPQFTHLELVLRSDREREVVLLEELQEALSRC